jgi:hypothetical protein
MNDSPTAFASQAPRFTGSTVLLWIQGTYYSLTGLWPIISMQSFQAVTGRKTDHLVTGDESDHWLVLTVAGLIVAISMGILAAAWQRRPSPEVVLLAVVAAIWLTGIDIVYVARGTILPIYLIDAVAEILLLLTWAGLIAVTRLKSKA